MWRVYYCCFDNNRLDIMFGWGDRRQIGSPKIRSCKQCTSTEGIDLDVTSSDLALGYLSEVNWLIDKFDLVWGQ